jgi:hypothetical protein
MKQPKPFAKETDLCAAFLSSEVWPIFSNLQTRGETR